MKKIIRLSLALLALGFVSCEKELPSQVEQPYDTEISAISIVNAGADGATVIEGLAIKGSNAAASADAVAAWLA